MKTLALAAGPAPLTPQFQPAAPRRPGLFEEISANDARFWLPQPRRLANPDELVGRRGLRIYSEMRTDDQVWAALKLKKHAVLSTGWEVVSPDDASPQEKAAAAFVKWNLEEGMTGTLDDDLLEVLCLHGDTIIHSPEGDRPVRELVGARPLVYSYVDGRMVLARSSSVALSSRNAPCVRVVYKWRSGYGRSIRWNETAIICTDTHPFLLRSGGYRRAGRLCSGDRLMPFDTTIRKDGYVMITPPHERQQKRACWVYRQACGPIPDGFCVHHVNENKRDDAPENLELRASGPHVAEHTQRRAARMTRKEKLAWTRGMRRGFTRGLAEGADWVRRMREKRLVTIATPEHKERLSRINLKSWQDPDIAERRRAGMSRAWTPERRAALAERNRDRVWTEEMRRKKSESQRRAMLARRRSEADNHEVVSVEPWGLADVYDVSVPGAGNFAANCVFVHNTASDFGYSVTERVHYPVLDGDWAGRIGLKKLATRRPHDFLFVTDTHDNLMPDGIEQFGKRFPRDRFVLYATNKEFDNWYGTSDLRAAYRAWWFKDNVLRWWGIFLDRYGIPLAVGKIPREFVGQAGEISDLRTALDRLQSATSMTLPDDIDLQFPAVASAQGAQVFSMAVEKADLAIARALLLPNLLGVSAQGDVGSYSQARKQFDVFILIIEKLQRDLAEIVMGEQVIKPLVRLNFDVQRYPTFVFLPFTESNKGELLGMFNQAIAAGVVQARPPDEIHVRSMTEFPEADLAEIEAEHEAEKAKEAAGAGGGLFSPGPGGEGGPGGPGPEGVAGPGAGESELSDEELDALIEEALGGGGEEEPETFAKKPAVSDEELDALLDEVLGEAGADDALGEEEEQPEGPAGEQEPTDEEVALALTKEHPDWDAEQVKAAVVEWRAAREKPPQVPMEEDEGADENAARRAELEAAVRQEHPDWASEQVAAEVEKRLAGAA